ncbi:MAG TPA: ABC transporter permease [Mycobacteriales bacterium]|nr:ABC transporter permease [Mycobacteriales bacterium]
MLNYIVKRAVMSLIIIFIVISASFYMIRLMPGNAMGFLQAQLQQQGGLTPDEIQQRLNAVYGVTSKAPLWQQYLDYVGNAFRGDFGNSLINPGASVLHIIANSIPWTIFVVAVALLISFVIGIVVGTVMAAYQDSRFAKFITFIVSFLSAVPNYLVAIVLIYFLADLHRVFPIGAAYSLDAPPGWNFPFLGSVIWHGVLPIIAYVVTAFGGWALAMKGSVVSVLGSEYVRAAKSWGLSGRRVTQSYVGRNSMLPQVTSLALSLGYMFGGSVLIETFFSYPGIGYYLVQAINSRDYSVMMGCFILITVAVVLSNFLIDLLYPMVDPRIASPAAPKKASLGAHGDAVEQTTPVVGGTVA